MTLQEYINAFQRGVNGQNSNVSSESKHTLNTAVTMLNGILADNSSDEAQKRTQCDIIMVGAMIYALMQDDYKYGLQEEFGNNYLYPLNFSEMKLTSQTKKEEINEIGRRALIEKSIPCTGSFNALFFPVLSSVVTPQTLANYQLNQDPNTMISARGNKEKEEKLERAAYWKKYEEERNAYNKWIKPFGWEEEPSPLAFSFDMFYHHNNDKQAPKLSDFDIRRANVTKAYDDQVSTIKNAKYKIIALVALSAIFPPALFFTIPRAIKAFKKLDGTLSTMSVQKILFTREQYDNVIKLRAEKKREFNIPKSPDLTKFKKVCIGYDEKGKETKDIYQVANVVMYCDQAKALRWSPKFLNNITNAVDYTNTVSASIENTASAPFNRFTFK